MIDPTQQLILIERYLDLGRPEAAVETARELLAAHPEETEGHALLALALLDLRRLTGARSEADAALALDPEHPMAVHAAALTAISEARFDEAERHVLTLQSLSPDDASTWHVAAYLARMTGRHEEERAHLQHACALEPGNPAYLADLGEHHLRHGDAARARKLAVAALEADPTATEPMLLMAGVLLHDGDLDGAHTTVLDVLRGQPDHLTAVHRLTEIKARQSRWLGVWWRYNAWLYVVGPSRAIVIVLVAFMAYRVLTQLGHDTDNPALVGLVQLAWLASCAYTWLAPTVFRRMLDAELAPVEMAEDF